MRTVNDTIDSRSAQYESQITIGCEGIKPGWARLNFNYFISEEVFAYLVSAVDLLARYGWALLEDYRFEITSGLWRHRLGPVEPPLRLTDLHYDPATGELVHPHHDDRAGEQALAGHLEHARAVLAEAVDRAQGPAAMLPGELAHLQWFDLPEACVKPA